MQNYCQFIVHTLYFILLGVLITHLQCLIQNIKQESFWWCFIMPNEAYCVYATRNGHFASICNALHAWIGSHDNENWIEM